MPLPPAYTLSYNNPSPAAYNDLRLASGLTPFSIEAATLGLPNSLFTVLLLRYDSSREASEPDLIGMGRVTGDRGCFYQVTDICVLPAYRGKGLAKAIMSEIERWLCDNVPKTGFVALCADGEAYRLYEQFGFSMSAPASLGMSRTF